MPGEICWFLRCQNFPMEIFFIFHNVLCPKDSWKHSCVDCDILWFRLDGNQLFDTNKTECQCMWPPSPSLSRREKEKICSFSCIWTCQSNWNEFKEDVFDVSHWSIIMRPVPILWQKMGTVINHGSISEMKLTV